MSSWTRLFGRLKNKETQLAIAIFISLVGGSVQAIIGPYYTILSTLITYGSILWAMRTFYGMLKDQNKKIDQTLKEHMPPAVFMSPPIAKSRLTEAFTWLGTYLWRLHKSGSFPAFVNLQCKITLRILTMEEAMKSGLVPNNAPDNTSWLWLDFIIEEESEVFPGPNISNPLDFIPWILVCDKRTLDRLIAEDLLTPIVSVYYPVPEVLSSRFRTFLKEVNYVSEASYIIKKITQQRPYPEIQIDLKPVKRDVKRNKKRDEFQDHLKDLLPGVESLWNQISEGFLQLLKPTPVEKDGNRLEDLYITPDEKDAKWKITYKCRYIIPGKVKEGGRVLWDQKMYAYPFSATVIDIRRIEFIIDADKKITLDNRLYPLIFIKGSAKYNLEDRWVIEGISYAFPDDVIIFRWDDNLIKELS
jgi:hypothetical protein